MKSCFRNVAGGLIGQIWDTEGQPWRTGRALGFCEIRAKWRV